MKILIADDKQDWIEPVKLSLEDLGHEVDVSFRGRDVAPKLVAGSFELVILDIFFSETDHADSINEIIPKIRGDIRIKDIGIIVVSAHDTPESAEGTNQSLCGSDPRTIHVPKAQGVTEFIKMIDKFSMDGKFF